MYTLPTFLQWVIWQKYQNQYVENNTSRPYLSFQECLIWLFYRLTHVSIPHFKKPLICSPFPVCVGGFPHQQINLQDTSWVSYNLTQFWHYLSRNSIGFLRLRIQSYMTAITPPQMPVTNPGCYLCFWQTSYRLEVPTTFLGSINLLEQFTKLNKTFYLPDCLIIIIQKDVTQK